MRTAMAMAHPTPLGEIRSELPLRSREHSRVMPISPRLRQVPQRPNQRAQEQAQICGDELQLMRRRVIGNWARQSERVVWAR